MWIQDGGCFQFLFLLIIDVIMTSLILLNIIYVLANFLILSDTLLFKYFSLCVYFEGNLVSVNNFNNYMTS